MLVLGRLLLPRLFAQAARTKSPELFLSASLLVVIVASLATTAAGLSPIVGAIIAGVLIAETDYVDEVEVITAPFRGLALGVFLITVGMSLDFRAIVADWPALLVAAIAGVVLVKALVTGLLLRLSGAAPSVAAEAGLIMASPFRDDPDRPRRRRDRRRDHPRHRRLLDDRHRDRPHHHALARPARPRRRPAGRSARAGPRRGRRPAARTRRTW